MTAVVFRLLSEDTPVLRIQLQLTELLPMERIYRRPHRQDSTVISPISRRVLTLFIAVFLETPVAAAMVL